MIKGVVEKIQIISGIVRLPNLIIIALTLALLRYLVVLPVLLSHSMRIGMKTNDFLLFLFSILCIAAAGYIINDCYDYKTDIINKPEKVYINKFVTLKTAFIVACGLSISSLVLGVVLSLHISTFAPFSMLCFALFVVWWYAIRLKKTLLWGNIAVACMSACTIPLLYLTEKVALNVNSQELRNVAMDQVMLIFLAFAIFAFLLTLIREIVKDVEDIEGDTLIGCNTLPIVKGSQYSKRFIFFLSVLVLLLLFAVLVPVYSAGLHLAFYWLIVSVFIPLIAFVFKLLKAKNKKDYHFLSTLLKLIMLGGIITLFVGTLKF